MTERPRMYIPTGISCAGKSTLGRAISETKGVEMIELNVIQKEMGIGLQGEHIPEEQFAVFHHEAKTRARKRLQEGKSIVYDTTPFTREKREQLRQLATECGADTILIYVKASIALALQRWEAANTNPDRHIDVHIDN